jgi:hypothetical protein
MVIQSLKAGRPLVLVDIPANALYAVGLAMGFKVVQTVFGEKNNGIPPSNN